ncbi:MAG: hypothetical protein ACI85N_000451 [Gammaproteobacteria bacterium]|jgi:hypothetical protein
MTKFVLRTLVISAILIGLGLYVNYLLTGNTPNLVIQKPSIPDLNLSKISESATDLFDLNGDASSDTKYLYKWRDAKGIIHYASEKPAADIEIEKIKLSSETNIVPAVSTADTNQNAPQIQLPQSVNVDKSNENFYSPQGIEQLFDQANDVKNRINEHYDPQSTSPEQQ